MPGQTTFKTLEKAAKAYGATHGVKGGSGGWLREYGEKLPAAGRRLYIQGWNDYGLQLIDRGIIDPQDENGRSVRRIEQGSRVIVRGHVAWRVVARRFEIVKDGAA